MQDRLDYYKYKHLQAHLCWAIINFVLTFAYVIEVVKGERTLIYIIMFLLVVWTPFVVYSVQFRCYINNAKYDALLEKSIGYGYMISYGFAVLTGDTPLTFVYFFPMLCILTSFHNRTLNRNLTLIAVALNAIKLSFSLGINPKLQLTPAQITDYEIILACLLLCGFFSDRGCVLLARRDALIKKLSRDANHDILTKIHNRVFIPDYEDKLKAEEAHITSVALIDIDDFKQINDTYGHCTGDMVLIKLAELMTMVTNMHPKTYAIRLGGDEFTIVSATLTAEEMFEQCKKLKDKLISDPPHCNDIDKPLEVTLSIGVIAGDGEKNFSTLYREGDVLLYDAKKDGKNVIKM